jgi:hypothetical protein
MADELHGMWKGTFAGRPLAPLEIWLCARARIRRTALSARGRRVLDAARMRTLLDLALIPRAQVCSVKGSGAMARAELRRLLDEGLSRRLNEVIKGRRVSRPRGDR